jgi:hypothetical protein
MCDYIGVPDFDDAWCQSLGPPVLKQRWSSGLIVRRTLYLVKADRNLTALPQGPTLSLSEVST